MIFFAIFFGILAIILMEWPIAPIDQTVHDWVSAHITTEMRAPLVSLTALGKSSFLAVLTVIIAALLYRKRWVREAALLVGGFGGLAVIITIIKASIARPRPEAAMLVNATSGSFPSSHTALSLFFYGFGAALLSRYLANSVARTAVLMVGFGMAVSIAASRVLLNAHWLTDVIAGFALSLIALRICVRLAEKKS
jgi:undecaprenyl-diphosphatase